MTKTPQQQSWAVPEAIQPDERLFVIDALRGVALFGILLVNVLDYASEPANLPDRVTARAIAILAEGSFFPLFSLLFGVGFAIFLDRARERGTGGIVLYLRRIAALFLIGLTQIVFLEDRNILMRYSFLALPLLLAWRASWRTCVFVGLACISLSLARPALLRQWVNHLEKDPRSAEASFHQSVAQRAQAAARSAEAGRVDKTRSYWEAVRFRAVWVVPNELRWSSNLARNPTLFHILGMFLLGVATWRSGLLLKLVRYRITLRRFGMTALAAGIAGNVVTGVGADTGPIALLTGHPIITTCISVLSNTGLTIAYALLIASYIGSDRDAAPRWVRSIAITAPMGLSNYIWQSVAMSVLFLPYAFGLQGKLPLRAFPVVASTIYATHVLMSRWWLRRYRLGPVEWLWKTATYWRLQPMRVARITESVNTIEGFTSA